MRRFPGPTTFGWTSLIFLAGLLLAALILNLHKYGLLHIDKATADHWGMLLFLGSLGIWLILDRPTSVTVDDNWITQWLWWVVPRRLARCQDVRAVRIEQHRLLVDTPTGSVWVSQSVDPILLQETASALARQLGLQAPGLGIGATLDDRAVEGQSFPATVSRTEDEEGVRLSVAADNQRLLAPIYGCGAVALGFLSLMAMILCIVMAEDPTMLPRSGGGMLFWAVALGVVFCMLSATLWLARMSRRPRFGKISLRLTASRLEIGAPGGQVCQIPLADLEGGEVVASGEGPPYVALWAGGRFYQIAGLSESSSRDLWLALRLAIAEIRARPSLDGGLEGDER